MVVREDFENQERYRETSLIDLAKILVRRRYALYIAFCLVFLAGLIFALMSDTRFRYTTIYNVGQPEKVGSTELLGELIAGLENTFIPEFIDSYRKENGHKPPFRLSVNPPKHGAAIMLYSDATQENSDLVREAHVQIVQELKEREAELISAAKARLESRLEGIEVLISRLQDLEDPGAALAEAYTRRTELEAELVSANKGEAVAIARESVDKVSGSRALIGIITVMFALVIGVFFAFAVEFVAKVRESLEPSEERGRASSD